MLPPDLRRKELLADYDDADEVWHIRNRQYRRTLIIFVCDVRFNA